MNVIVSVLTFFDVVNQNNDTPLQDAITANATKVIEVIQNFRPPCPVNFDEFQVNFRKIVNFFSGLTFFRYSENMKYQLSL